MDIIEIEKRWESGFDLYSDKDMKQLHTDVEWLIKRAIKADRYEDLALKHQYGTIIEEMEED